MEQEEKGSDLYNVILLFYLKCTFVEHQVAELKYEYSQIISILLPEICKKSGLLISEMRVSAQPDGHYLF